MIAKITWGRDFSGIVDYLIEHRDHEVLDVRGVSSIEMASDEMALTSALSARVKSPVAHISFSAALEDRELDRATWIKVVEAAEAELGLSGHQRVVVRHKDKGYDHIHVFFCTVSPFSGQTPPRQWFLSKGAVDTGAGALALTLVEIESVPADQRVRGAWNHRALIRLQQLCRGIEKRFGLRTLRSPREIAEARSKGEVRPADPRQAHRAERTGATLLTEQGDAIRAALDTPTWSDARRALARIGLAIEPAIRTSKANGPSISGLLVYELADPNNRITASQLDLPGRKYGLRQIEKRHAENAPIMELWWPDRGPAPITANVIEPEHNQRAMREAYRLARERHRAAESNKAALRRKMAARHKRQFASMSAQLIRRRRKEAALIDACERRAFYAEFSRRIRQAAMSAFVRKCRAEARPLRRSRMLTWKEFLATQDQHSLRPKAVASVGSLSRAVPARQEQVARPQRLAVPSINRPRLREDARREQPEKVSVDDAIDITVFEAERARRDRSGR